MEKHFVIFFSPGTFVAEESRKPIEAWNVSLAVLMSKDIKERYGATPYGFCFITRERSKEDLDSKEVKRSKMYYLGGEVLTLAKVKTRNNDEDRILIQNMEGNKITRIVISNNYYRTTLPLGDDDVVLDMSDYE